MNQVHSPHTSKSAKNFIEPQLKKQKPALVEITSTNIDTTPGIIFFCKSVKNY